MLCMVRTKTINVVAVNRTNRHNKQSKWLTDWKSPRFCMCVCCILYICGSCMKLLAHKWCCKIHICQTYLRTHAQTLLFQQTKTLQLQRTNSKFKACATFSRFGERVAHPCIIHFGPSCCHLYYFLCSCYCFSYRHRLCFFFHRKWHIKSEKL